MKRSAIRWTTACLGAALTSLALAGPAAPAGSGRCDTPVVLSATDQAVREDFNKARGTVRLVFLVDPVCSHCLRGMSDLDRDVLRPHAGDARLTAFVIHMSVLGAKQADVANACQVMPGTGAKHYWDPAGNAGRLFGQGLALKSEAGKDVFAWDVWAIYGPDAQWTSTLPPRPVFAMHQLSDLMWQKTYPFLDSSAFAKEVARQLASLKPAHGSTAHE
ncbi:MAG: hypothetical protein JSS45_08420 [Proteobacteria bacterium]|nr:hypothetical protein [Pseudomonadota bacterium]MBS0598851.1 hypothetical protein [Pseudomonadota bacterium]